MSIMDKLKKNSKIEETSILAESVLFAEKDVTVTEVPMVNVALSGDIDGGLTSGLTVLAGPSKHFKTSFALLMGAAYLKQHKDAVMLFYDSEFGSPQSYFESFGIDASRVLHTPMQNVEQLKFDLVGQLENIERGDREMAPTAAWVLSAFRLAAQPAAQAAAEAAAEAAAHPGLPARAAGPLLVLGPGPRPLLYRQLRGQLHS